MVSSNLIEMEKDKYEDLMLLSRSIHPDQISRHYRQLSKLTEQHPLVQMRVMQSKTLRKTQDLKYKRN